MAILDRSYHLSFMRLPDSNRPPCPVPPSPEGKPLRKADERLLGAFAPLAREVEENVELYFSDLAAVSDSIAGDGFDDDTHASFYVASKEVISQGLASQLEFLQDNAPRAFAILLRKAGLAVPETAHRLPRVEARGNAQP